MFGFDPRLFWVFVIAATLVTEVCTAVSLSCIWFSVGGIAALIAAAIGFGTGSQIAVFVVFSIALLVVLRPFVVNVLRPKGAATNADRVIGQTAVVTEPINNMNAAGAVRVCGQVWSARAMNGELIPVDTRVLVHEIQGVKLIVEPIIEE